MEIVAKELKEELGIIAQREADSDPVERHPKAAARSDAVRDADASRELSPKDTGTEVGGVHGLAQRVARIELILAHSYTVLKRLLQAAERRAPARRLSEALCRLIANAE